MSGINGQNAFGERIPLGVLELASDWLEGAGFFTSVDNNRRTLTLHDVWAENLEVATDVTISDEQAMELAMNSLPSIPYEKLVEMDYSDEFDLNEHWTVYHYSEDECIVLLYNYERVWIEVATLQYDPEKKLVYIEQTF